MPKLSPATKASLVLITGLLGVSATVWLQQKMKKNKKGVRRRKKHSCLGSQIGKHSTIKFIRNIIDICIQILILVKYIFPHVHDRKPTP